VNQTVFRSPASVFAVPVLVLTVFYLRQQVPDAEYYGLGQLAKAASAVAIVGPLCAGLAAWEGARVRAGRVHRLAPARRECLIAIRSLLPIWLLALVALSAATVFALSAGPSLRIADLRLLAVPAAVVLAHTSLGYAVGRVVPAVFAIPLVLVASWLWIVYPIALSPLWLRHLTGYLNGCCDASTVLDAGAFAAPIVVSAGAVLAALALVSRLPAAGRAGLAAAVVATGLLTGIHLVSGLEARPTTPRPSSELVCAETDPVVCLWPEHAALTGLVHQRATVIRRRLGRIGVRTPAVVGEGGPKSAWRIGVVPGARRDAVDTTLVEGLLPPFPRCASGEAPYPGVRAYWPVALWIAHTTGSSTELLRYSVTGADRDEVEAVQALPERQQAGWYQANRRALTSCKVEPRLLVPR
jgi:hypothetical protein